MKKLFVAMAALAWLAAATCVSADAADRRLAPIAKAPPVATPDWSGPYIGLDAGVQATRTDLTTTNITTVGPFFAPFAFAPEGATTLPYNGTGFRMAGFAGYNWQVANQWVLGFEGDVAWADTKTTLGGVAVPALFCCATASFSSSVRTDWDASLRARIGVLLTPSLLAYLTGGLAWQHFEENSSCGPPFCAAVPPPGLTFVPFSFTHGFTKAAWTIGGGAETMLSPNWIARVNYRYADFGTVTFSNTNIVTGGVAGGTTLITATQDLKVRTHTASLGVAYLLGGPAVSTAASLNPSVPIYKARAAAAAPRWTGFYVGLDAGLLSTRTDVTTTSAFVNGVANDFTNFATSAPLNASAFRLGPYAGHDWQVAPQWVLGLQADWSWARRTAALPGFPFTPGFFTSGIANDALAVRTSWDASLRGRVGHLLTPAFLAYVTGGAAWLHYDAESSCPGLCSLPITSLGPIVIASAATKAGWTVGGGFESWLWDQWFARAEYRYADFGTEPFTLVRTGPGLIASVVDNFDVRIRTHTVTVGMAYKLAN